MKDFKTWINEDAWGVSQGDRQLFANVDEKMRDLRRDVEALSDRLTHGDGPVAHAWERFSRHWDALRGTIQAAVEKNANNPEWSDHPPVSSS